MAEFSHKVNLISFISELQYEICRSFGNYENNPFAGSYSGREQGISGASCD
jgi:hypothetical protein